MKDNELTSGYALSRSWFDFAFENYDKVTPNHTAMIMWFIELNNRMGWASKFASPASQTMTALGLKSYNTYKKTFDDLVNWKFVKVIKESKNQWSACVIALSNFDKAQYKALDKALATHGTKQSESTEQSTDSITKLLNKETIKPLNKGEESFEKIKLKAKKSFENNNCLFGEEFKKVWLQLLEEPKWKNKTQSAIDKSLQKLMKYDETFSSNLVETAISGGWQGVVYTDTDIKYENYLKLQNNGNRNTASQSRQQRVDEVAEFRRANQQLIIERLQKHTAGNNE